MNRVKTLLFFCSSCDDKWDLGGDCSYDERECEICGKNIEGQGFYSVEIELSDLLLKIMRAIKP